jgi:hypothetical protein
LWQVTSVKRLENPHLWDLYGRKKAELQRRIQLVESGEGLQGVGSKPGSSGDVLTNKVIRKESFLRRDLAPEVCITTSYLSVTIVT